MSRRGELVGEPEVLARLAAAGVRTAADVLARAEAVRDLPARSNHVLRVGGDVIHVKRSKCWGPSREARGIRRAAAAGVPVARIAFEGRAGRIGSVVGTFDLAPARPLDDLLRDGAIDAAMKADLLAALAETLGALHGAALCHRDLYLNHVYANLAARPPSVTLIDFERLGRRLGLLGHRVVKDLAAIEASIPDGTVPDPQKARFLVRYLRARGLPVRALIGPLAVRIGRKAARIRRHAPRTPVGGAARPVRR